MKNIFLRLCINHFYFESIYESHIYTLHSYLRNKCNFIVPLYRRKFSDGHIILVFNFSLSTLNLISQWWNLIHLMSASQTIFGFLFNRINIFIVMLILFFIKTFYVYCSFLFYSCVLLCSVWLLPTIV